MKRSLLTIGILGLLGSTPVLCWPVSSRAGNSGVEAGLQSFGDLSMFYQALLNTGVINDLKENETYTIFAPVNVAFAQIPPSSYPCFYAVECRPQIAALLRDHIIVGHHNLTDLVSYGQGIQTDGVRRIHVEEPFVNDYAVENQRILSTTDIDGNIIYRINGVVTNPEELAQFKTVNVVPVSDTVTEKTVIEKTYHPAPPLPNAYPAGTMAPASPGANDGSTTTIIRTYRTESQ